jgi:hypothetical protein
MGGLRFVEYLTGLGVTCKVNTSSRSLHFSAAKARDDDRLAVVGISVWVLGKHHSYLSNCTFTTFALPRARLEKYIRLYPQHMVTELHRGFDTFLTLPHLFATFPM